jgi:hypothetical protein
MAMNADYPRAVRAVRHGCASEKTGADLGVVQELNEMPATKNVPTDDAYYVSAADLADKIIVLMQRGSNPLHRSRRMRVIFETSRPVFAD